MSLRTVIILLALGWPAGMTIAQPRPDSTAIILKGPAGWRFERMATPPEFAPDIRLTGFEEARFAPGMFDTASPNYFTYVLAVSANGAAELDSAGLTDFLEKYYRGLSVSVGRQKGLSPDPAQMNVDMAADQSDEKRRSAKVTFFDTFNDGRKITLNVEARVVRRVASKKTGLILLISPQPKGSVVWQTLREIGGKIDFGDDK